MMKYDRSHSSVVERVSSRSSQRPRTGTSVKIPESLNPRTGFSHKILATQHPNADSPHTILGTDANELRPHVTAAIYILQALGAIAGFLVKLSTIIYNKFFTVRRVELLTIERSRANHNDRSRSRSMSKHGRVRSVSRNRPYLPSDRDLATQMLWNYMKLNQPLRQSDVIVLLGNFDYRTYEYACQLWSAGWAEVILFITTSDLVNVREDQRRQFLHIAEIMNIPEECIMFETESSNIVDAIISVYKTIKVSKVKSLIFVHIPFMERLVQLTFEQIWPDKSITAVVTSPAITLVNYPTDFTGTEQQLSDDLIETLNFLLKYDKSLAMSIPRSVIEAYTILTGHQPDLPSKITSPSSSRASIVAKSHRLTDTKSTGRKLKTAAGRKSVKSTYTEPSENHSSSLRSEFQNYFKVR